MMNPLRIIFAMISSIAGFWITFSGSGTEQRLLLPYSVGIGLFCGILTFAFVYYAEKIFTNLSAKALIGGTIGIAAALLLFLTFNYFSQIVGLNVKYPPLTYPIVFLCTICVGIAIGIKKGDRIAAYLPNVPETIVSMLASTALGAIFSSASPDFGSDGVLDRFGQIQPKILITADGYNYNGKEINVIEVLENITISFNLDYLGLVFLIVSNGLWFMTSIYTNRYLKLNNYQSHGKFFIFF